MKRIAAEQLSQYGKEEENIDSLLQVRAMQTIGNSLARGKTVVARMRVRWVGGRKGWREAAERLCRLGKPHHHSLAHLPFSTALYL